MKYLVNDELIVSFYV